MIKSLYRSGPDVFARDRVPRPLNISICIGYERGWAQIAKTLKVTLHLVVENNNKFVRGKKRSREEIEQLVLSHYAMRKPDPKGYDYELTIPYENDKDLDNTIYDILQEASSIADRRNGFIEAECSPRTALSGTGDLVQMPCDNFLHVSCTYPQRGRRRTTSAT